MTSLRSTIDKNQNDPVLDSGLTMKEIKMASSDLSPENEPCQGHVLQKRLNQTFTGLQNLTLPFAYRLRDVALQAGLFIEPK